MVRGGSLRPKYQKAVLTSAMAPEGLKAYSKHALGGDGPFRGRVGGGGEPLGYWNMPLRDGRTWVQASLLSS